MASAFALELAIHMFLKPSGFSINLFLLQPRRQLPFFFPSISLECHWLCCWGALQCCGRSGSAEGRNDPMSGQDDAAQALVFLPFRAGVQEFDSNGAAGIVHIDNTGRRETTDARGVDQERILIEDRSPREASTCRYIDLRENVEVAAGRKIRRCAHRGVIGYNFADTDPVWRWRR